MVGEIMVIRNFGRIQKKLRLEEELKRAQLEIPFKKVGAKLEALYARIGVIQSKLQNLENLINTASIPPVLTEPKKRGRKPGAVKAAKEYIDVQVRLSTGQMVLRKKTKQWVDKHYPLT